MYATSKLKKKNCRICKYPNSLLRLFAAAFSAFPPEYFLLKSSLICSRKAIGICRPTDSTATTQ